MTDYSVYDVDRNKKSKKKKHKSDKKEHKEKSSSSSSKKSSKSSSEKSASSPSKKKEVSKRQIVQAYEKQKLQQTMSVLNENSMFAQDADKILGLLDSQENDNAITLAQKESLKTIIHLISIAEATYREFPKQSNAYALSNFISQMRELIADLQANADKSVVIDRIIYDILQPTAMQITSFLIEMNFQLKKDLEKLIVPDARKEANDKIDNATKMTGAYIKETFVHLKARIEKSLSET